MKAVINAMIGIIIKITEWGTPISDKAIRGGDIYGETRRIKRS